MRNRVCFVAILCVLLAVGCKDKKMDIEYERIKNSGKTGQELFDILSDFERNNTTHFSSKVDLGGVFLIQGDYARAKDYFLRAEAVLPKNRGDDEIRKNTVIMYGALARIALVEGNYENGLQYLDKAFSYEKEQDPQYQFLKAHILSAQNKNEEALAIFDSLYPDELESMTSLDLRAYMYLLSRYDRTEECAVVLEQYFDKGSYFQGLGLFASTVYEKNGDTKKSILSAFLDYEFHSAYNNSDDREFLKNLDTLERRLIEGGKIEKARYAINLVRSLYSSSFTPPPPPDNERFFIEDYVIIKNKINRHTVNLADFNRLLQLEHYFSQFPVYYWNVWQTVEQLDPDAKQSFLRILEKIIALDKQGAYAKPAWNEITKIMGYK